ncbi:MAG: tRNA preQ1(34) S-adenosylmethionine ribosyltransferase-isomerase QueA [Legionellales bacterium]|nr:tRNA preQ1(34) S-adenosylmethionine ribosyltransferase-isomerase QueA [Legionellales bacterium]
MRRDDFAYELPSELIAQQPRETRDESRLLTLDRASQTIAHHQFGELITRLQAGDLLVFNNTRVMFARLFGHKATGGQVELLIERVLSDQQFLTQIKASKAPQPGSQIYLTDETPIQIEHREGALYQCRLIRSTESIQQVMRRLGQLPLPPYIQRAADALDESRYQTVYAQSLGAVAAPTAGLHFTQALLEKFQQAAIQTAFMTLHVGAGTFVPVRVERICDHKMHREWMEVSPALCQQIQHTKQQGKRVIAVGTTVVRGLESAALSGVLQPYMGDTDIFITPGFQFKVVDGLITNFHLPESTLLMLVCAFAGYDAVMAAYQTAVAQRYRFFSYGDAMLLL